MTTSRSSRRAGARRGFTLVELMIAVTILMIAIAIAIPFFLTQSRALAAQSGRLDAQLNANFALDAIERDLRVAGVGLPARQPLLVQAAANAITFSADLTGTSVSDFSTVYYDPDADPLTVGVLTPTDAIILPNSTWSYPDSMYWQSPGVPSAAETISYWVEADTGSSGLMRVMRRVNNAPARVMARGIVATGQPYFRYYELDAVGQLQEIPTTSLPIRHLPGIHGAPGDTGAVARVDSIRVVRIDFTAMYRDPRFQDVLRREERLVRIMNAGLIHASTCGDLPLPTGTLTATATTTPSVMLSWAKSGDEGAGEKDVERYAIYRRPVGVTTFGEPIAAIAAGQSLYVFEDTDVTPGGQYIYGVAAQDCTPAVSSVSTFGPVLIP